MKFAFLLISLLVVHTTSNFKIEDGKLFWQKVYTSDLDIAQVEQSMIEAGYYKNVIVINQSITAEIIDFPINYSGYGASNFATPSYITGSSFQAFAVFEFKNNRYRVTIKNIKLIQNHNTSHTDMGEVSLLENHALKKKNTAFKNGFIQDAAPMMDYSFHNIANFERKSSDW